MTETAELLHGALCKQRALGYRQAAAELEERADELDREARQVSEVVNIVSRADAELNRGARRVREVVG